MAHNLKTEEQLKNWMIKEWDKLDLETINNNIDKMIERIPRIIAVGGAFVD